jgi:hypothetical protein
MAYASRQETDLASRIVKIMQQDKRHIVAGQENGSYIRRVIEQDRRWLMLQDRI